MSSPAFKMMSFESHGEVVLIDLILSVEKSLQVIEHIIHRVQNDNM